VPGYSTHDPKGWCGDPSRGAALGRVSLKGEPEGKITVRRVPLDRQGYDPNGTYFGLGDRLFWVADEGGNVDFVCRDYYAAMLATSLRENKYPNSEVVVGEPLPMPCWGAGEDPCPDKANATHSEDFPDVCWPDLCEDCSYVEQKEYESGA
jgi:hypothetical protein